MPVNALSDGSPSRSGQTRLLWKLLQDLTPYRVLRRRYYRYFSLILSIQWHYKYLHVMLGLLYRTLAGLFIVPIFRAHFRVLSCLPGALWLRSAPLLVLRWLWLPGAEAGAGHREGGPHPALSSYRTWVSVSEPPGTARLAPRESLGLHGTGALRRRPSLQGQRVTSRAWIAKWIRKSCPLQFPGKLHTSSSLHSAPDKDLGQTFWFGKIRDGYLLFWMK